MYISRDKLSDDIISIDEFCERVSKKLSDIDNYNIWDCRQELQMLSNDKTIVLDQVHCTLKSLWDKETTADYVQSVFSICNHPFGQEHRFSVRAVYWDSTNESPHKNRMFIYEDIPHDHNFELLTIGHSGPGYDTSLWQYDNSKVIGYVGEKVDIHYQGRFTLAEDTIIYYQQNHDIHMQHAPNTPSVSLSLMFSRDKYAKQYFFNHQRQCIDSVLPSYLDKHLPLFTFASVLGDENTLDILENLIKKDMVKCRKNKQAAIQAVSVIHTKLTGSPSF